VCFCAQVIAQYSNAEVVWCQEEPKNMGAHAYIKPRLDTAMRELAPQIGVEPRPIRYIGRSASASVGKHTLNPSFGTTSEGSLTV
jgi:2-oxoglutarate dehydrogenase E1 component